MTRLAPMTRMTVVVVAASLALVACGGPSDEQRRQDLADDLVAETDGALDDEAAMCVADGLYDAFADESIDRVIAVAEGAEDDTEVRTRVVDVFADCDALAAVTDAG